MSLSVEKIHFRVEILRPENKLNGCQAKNGYSRDEKTIRLHLFLSRIDVPRRAESRLGCDKN